MWSENKPSKRKTLIVDMDDSLNQYSIISEENNTTYKLIIGNQDISCNSIKNLVYILQFLGNFSRVFLGENATAHFPDPSLDEETPPYNHSAVLKSLTNIAIGQLKETALTETTIAKLQKESTLRCDLPKRSTPLTCIKPKCLFDLKNDPCEVKNIIENQQGIAKNLKTKLDEYWKVLMPELPREDMDPLMNPVLYNGTYCTFLENWWCTRTKKIWTL